MLFRLSMAVALLAGAASSANAVTTLMWSSTADVGKTQAVSFDGQYGASINRRTVATALPGLSSTLALTLTKVSGKDWTFDYAVDNTSLAPVVASKVSVFGFDSLGKISGGSSTGVFGKSGSGPVPLLGSSADICFRASGSDCTGGNSGLAIDDAASKGSLTLRFEKATPLANLSNFFVRYAAVTNADKSINNVNGTSGDAMLMADTVDGVPEPASWAMMITGFGLIGGALRRRRTMIATATC
jgi:hypothetical protein